MRLEIAAHAPRVRVTLSRRNLMALLVKLDGWPTDSECSITLGSSWCMPNLTRCTTPTGRLLAPCIP